MIKIHCIFIFPLNGSAHNGISRTLCLVDGFMQSIISAVKILWSTAHSNSFLSLMLSACCFCHATYTSSLDNCWCEHLRFFVILSLGFARFFLAYYREKSKISPNYANRFRFVVFGRFTRHLKVTSLILWESCYHGFSEATLPELDK